MLKSKEIRDELDDLFQIIRLQARNLFISMDNRVKIEQILAYLESLDVEICKIPKDQKVVIIDSCAGNCYLSYLVFYYYKTIEKREIEIHCVDYNDRLMNCNREQAKKLNFEGMFFYTSDIDEFSLDKKVDVVYSLHACDTATDKTMYLGLRSEADAVLTVSCCQHSITMRSQMFKSVIRHKSFRDKFIMMISDSLRALLLEKSGYGVSVFDFVPACFTEKNTMIKAIRGNASRSEQEVMDEYDSISTEFRMKPHLESLVLG